MAEVAKHLTIHGRVQGVFFRDWTMKAARELGLVGWVRNRRDGTVEAVVQGEEEAVERFINFAKDGPPAAAVESLNSEPADKTDLPRFEKRKTM